MKFLYLEWLRHRRRRAARKHVQAMRDWKAGKTKHMEPCWGREACRLADRIAELRKGR